MKRALLRSVSLYARTGLLSPPCYNLRPIPKIGPLAASTRPRLGFYSTESQSHNKAFSNDAEDDVSNEELKMQIESYFRGNDEAIPSIFESILKRKLTGKHEETDNKLMREIHGKRRGLLSDDEDEEFESDLDLYESDEEINDLTDAMDDDVMKDK